MSVPDTRSSSLFESKWSAGNPAGVGRRKSAGRIAGAPLTLLCHFLRGGHHRVSAFDDGEVRYAHAEGATHFAFDLSGEIGVVREELLRVLTSLSEAHVAVGEPGAG